MWMEPEEVVGWSLAALGSGQVVVVAGGQSQSLARMGARNTLDALGQ
jgi:hypothetical protein